MVNIAAQTQVPAVLRTPATQSVFCNQYSARVLSALQDNYYPLGAPLSTTSSTSQTFDVQYGDYIQGVSLVCSLPAIVNVTTQKVTATGAAGGTTYRAIVPSASNMTTNTTLEACVVREGVAGTTIGVVANDPNVTSLANERNLLGDFAAHYCDYTGARLIQSVQLLVNGKCVQSFTGSWLFAYNELFRTEEGKAAAAIGAADPSTVSDGKISTAKKVDSLRRSELEIELPFFFSQGGDGCGEGGGCGGVGGGGGPFPRFQFSRHDAVQIRFTFNSLGSLVVNGAGIGNELLTIVADRSSVPIPVYTVTVPDNAGSLSAVTSYLTKLTSAPASTDFNALDFTFGVRVREMYVDATTLKTQGSAVYRAIVAQPYYSEASSTVGAAATDVVLDTMKHASMPALCFVVYARLLEHTLQNNWYFTSGPPDPATGRTQSSISQLTVHLGSTTLVANPTQNYRTKRAAAMYANSVPKHYDISYCPIANKNPFCAHEKLTSVPQGCVMLNSMKGTKVVVRLNAATCRDGTNLGGADYSSGRGSIKGNSVTVCCHTLMFNTFTSTPDPTNKADPGVQLGVGDAPQLTRLITSN